MIFILLIFLFLNSMDQNQYESINDFENNYMQKFNSKVNDTIFSSKSSFLIEYLKSDSSYIEKDKLISIFNVMELTTNKELAQNYFVLLVFDSSNNGNQCEISINDKTYLFSNLKNRKVSLLEVDYNLYKFSIEEPLIIWIKPKFKDSSSLIKAVVYSENNRGLQPIIYDENHMKDSRYDSFCTRYILPYRHAKNIKKYSDSIHFITDKNFLLNSFDREFIRGYFSLASKKLNLLMKKTELIW